MYNCIGRYFEGRYLKGSKKQSSQLRPRQQQKLAEPWEAKKWVSQHLLSLYSLIYSDYAHLMWVNRYRSSSILKKKFVESYKYIPFEGKRFKFSVLVLAFAIKYTFIKYIFPTSQEPKWQGFKYKLMCNENS